MKSVLCRVATLALAANALTAGAAYAGPVILNGSFETNSASGTWFNMLNSDFNATVSSATAFGSAQELDLVKDSDWFLAPQHGHWKLGLHTQYTGLFDAFSLAVSSPLVGGQSYSLSFYAARQGGNPVSIDIGLSTSATGFGTLIFTGAPSSGDTWDHIVTTFVAPNSGAFIAVRNQYVDGHDAYSFVDNFSIEELKTVPDPGSSLLLLGMGLAGLRAWKQRLG
jgi:hypothetical protein